MKQRYYIEFSHDGKVWYRSHVAWEDKVKATKSATKLIKHKIMARVIK